MSKPPVVDLECIDGVYQMADARRTERLSAMIVALFLAVMLPMVNAPFHHLHLH